MSTKIFSAPVIHGHHLGHTLGFPTINQTPPASFETLPRGVYFSRCTVDGVSYPAVSNLGVKPTVTDEDTLLCETHILNFDRDLYGQNVTTELIFFRRHECKFESASELGETLARDIRAAKEYFGS